MSRSDHNDQHNHSHQQCGCSQTAPKAVVQTLDEMEFERGIWTAALYNDTDRLDERIARGDTNLCDNYGYSALHYAARSGHADACVRLLRAGAHVDARTHAGGQTALHRAASMGRDDVVRLLLDHGATASLTDADGNTALHSAANAAHLSICEMLCHKDAGLWATQNLRQQRAIDLVPVDRRAEFVDLLVR